MKRTSIAIGLTLAATAAFAQAPAAPGATAAVEVPPAKCEPKPVYPGISDLKYEKDLEVFRDQLRAYQECIRNYLNARRASINAHTDAANAATAEHNAVIEKFRADQEAARKQREEQQPK